MQMILNKVLHRSDLTFLNLTLISIIHLEKNMVSLTWASTGCTVSNINIPTNIDSDGRCNISDNARQNPKRKYQTALDYWTIGILEARTKIPHLVSIIWNNCYNFSWSYPDDFSEKTFIFPRLKSTKVPKVLLK